MLYRTRRSGYKEGVTAEFAAILSPELLKYARAGGYKPPWENEE